jgi:hypothetical protein
LRIRRLRGGGGRWRGGQGLSAGRRLDRSGLRLRDPHGIGFSARDVGGRNAGEEQKRE